MIIKFIQSTRIDEYVYLPGTITDIPAKKAKQLIKDGVAIAIMEEESEEVTDGDRQNGS